MPINFEFIDFDDAAPVPGAGGESASQRSSSNLKPDNSEKEKQTMKKAPSLPSISAGKNDYNPKTKKHTGFFTRLKIWLNTPWGTSWRLSQKTGKKRSKKNLKRIK